jgi:hypothetical protein
LKLLFISDSESAVKVRSSLPHLWEEELVPLTHQDSKNLIGVYYCGSRLNGASFSFLFFAQERSDYFG